MDAIIKYPKRYGNCVQLINFNSYCIIYEITIEYGQMTNEPSITVKDKKRIELIAIKFQNVICGFKRIFISYSPSVFPT